MAKQLTPKQAAFAEAYVLLLNGTKAAIKAGFAASSAAVTSAKLLKLPRVKAEIAKQQAKLANDFDMSPAKILGELSRIAFANVADYVQWTEGTTTLNPSLSLTMAQSAAVGEVKQTRDGVSIKMHDKIAALDRLGKHLGLFESRDDTPAAVTIIVKRLFDDK